jgi:diguanylate cyclase (GGDEF)-like protein
VQGLPNQGSTWQAWRRWLPWLAGGLVWAALALLATVLLYYMDEKARLEVAAQARAALDEASDEIDARLDTALAVPETLAVVIAARGSLDLTTFRAIAARLVRANPSIRNVAMAPDNVITAIHPVQGNEATIGLRYASLPNQYGAVLQAMRTRRTVIAGPIALIQGGSGLVSRTPVYLGGRDGADSRYWGLVSLAVDMDQLFVNIARIGQRNNVAIAVRRFDAGQAPARVSSGDPRVFAGDPVSTFYPIPGGARLELAAGPVGGWGAVASVPPYARVLVHLLALLVGIVVHDLVAGRERDRMLASSDALTGLPNRQSFDHRLSEAMLRAAPHSCALVLVDLDDFKPVNDTHGHSAGDLVLRSVGARVQQVVGHAGIAYRIGGDEFALLLHGVRDAAEVRALSQRLVDRIGQAVPLDAAREVRIGASIGAAIFPLGGQMERATDVFDRADRALYRGKDLGGRRVHIEPLAAGGRTGA